MRLHDEADQLIRGMYSGRTAWAARERARELKAGAAFATVREDNEASAALYRLVYGLPKANRLMSIEPILPQIGPQAGNTGMDALLHFARFSTKWRREPEEWICDTDDARRQAGSLARHLFALYSTPDALDAAWLSGFGAQAENYRQWFVHLSGGGKLENLDFPMPMTHKAAHFFLQAPANYSLPAALRFGQIRALGGSTFLAQAISETFLSELQPDESFWLSVMHFFVNHPHLPAAQIGPLVDYLKFLKFGDNPDGDPSFTMKGRTLDALQKRMADWHATLARLGWKVKREWNPSGLLSFDKVAKDPLSAAMCHWRVTELTDTMALAEEGSIMRHCVRSYQDACIKGEKTIFSLRLTLSDNKAVRRLLTIEVNLHRRAVVQVRGKCNQALGQMRGNRRMMLARDILREWARSQHLGIACSL